MKQLARCRSSFVLFCCCLAPVMCVALTKYFSVDVSNVSTPRQLSMKNVDPEWAQEVPGNLDDRQTPLGELDWIFTAIMDAIAWNSLPSELFQKLFRQDQLVASLFRNFLLADRILR